MKMISKVGPNRNSPSPVEDRCERSKIQRNSAGDESEDGDDDRRMPRNGHSRGSDSDNEGNIL